MELKPCPGCGQLLQQDGKTPQGIIWRHPVIPVFCPLTNVVFCGEQFSVRWQSLPRSSGGLDVAVKQDISTVLDWIEVEEGHGGDAHDENCNICRAMERLRALPDSGDVERLLEYARDIIDAVDDGETMDILRARDQLADELAALAGLKP